MAEQKEISTYSIIYTNTGSTSKYSNTIHLPDPPSIVAFIIDTPEDAGTYNCRYYLEGEAYIGADQDWWDSYIIYVDELGELVIVGWDQTELDKYTIELVDGELTYTIP